MDDRELKLNSLSRYSKDSPLFILEEHGHCEVPAGCGGVVLRWRNPRAGVPFTMWLHTAGDCAFRLDGAEPPSSRPVVSYGEHVLAFTLSGVDPDFMVLMFAGGHRPEERRNVRRSRPDPVETTIVSAADGSWRYSLAEPADDTWMHAGFDDSGWSPMVPQEERPPPDEQGRDRDAYRVGRLAEFGAAGLGVAGRGERIWVRKAFTIPAPEEEA
ncbi:hypothetical protein DPM19_03040 [Actinomadura craniellae]|uniref:Uncharacterized protein n=1 Tax=Actinomadura craniellae TaxID=2231787 RepID=A0A365HDR1_9ACTN|nr:hypothetical protein [Actinomadura craniellae]RAY17148.1 hypothetical protein DPM19_03040 [Actinomadura craniellae]